VQSIGGAELLFEGSIASPLLITQRNVACSARQRQKLAEEATVSAAQFAENPNLEKKK